MDKSVAANSTTSAAGRSPPRRTQFWRQVRRRPTKSMSSWLYPSLRASEASGVRHAARQPIGLRFLRPAGVLEAHATDRFWNVAASMMDRPRYARNRNDGERACNGNGSEGGPHQLESLISWASPKPPECSGHARR